MKTINIVYDEKGHISNSLESDELYIAQQEDKAVIISATFPGNLAGTVNAYLEWSGGGDIVEGFDNININKHTAELTLSSDHLKYYYLKIGFEVVTAVKQIRFQPVELDVDEFVNATGNAGAKNGYTISVKIGNVTELEPGEAPYVINSGTDKHQVWDIGIPRGQQGIQGKPFTYEDFTEEQLKSLKGEQGIQGIQGIQGEKGDKGDTGEVSLEYAHSTFAPTIENTVNGEAIQLTDSADSKFRGLKLFGKTTQITTTGKNLFDYRTFTNSRYPPTINDDGSLDYNGTHSIKADISHLESGKTYVFNWKYTFDGELVTSNIATYRFYYDDGTYVASYYGNAITTDANKKLSYIDAFFKNGYNEVFSAKAWDIQITEGTALQEYEPYSGGVASPSPDWAQPLNSIGDDGGIEASVSDEEGNTQTLLLTVNNGLPGIPVTSDGNYTDADGQMWVCDEVDFEKGMYIQRVYEYKMKGTESIEISTSQDNITEGMVRYDGTVISPNTLVTACLCTHFPCLGQVVNKGYNAWVATYSYSPRLSVRFVTHHQTAAELKEWLAENYNNGEPVTFKYILETPIETPLTEEEIAMYKALQTYKPVTNIKNDENAYMEVDYAADTKTYIDNKIEDKFTALQNAIVSLGGNV